MFTLIQLFKDRHNMMRTMRISIDVNEKKKMGLLISIMWTNIKVKTKKKGFLKCIMLSIRNGVS